MFQPQPTTVGDFFVSGRRGLVHARMGTHAEASARTEAYRDMLATNYWGKRQSVISPNDEDEPPMGRRRFPLWLSSLWLTCITLRLLVRCRGEEPKRSIVRFVCGDTIHTTQTFTRVAPAAMTVAFT